MGSFKEMDLSIENIISEAYGKAFDVVISNDALMHNSNKNIQTILGNFNTVGKYLVVNSYVHGSNNSDVSMSEKPFPFRRLDLTTAPWSLSPLCGDEENHQKFSKADQG